MRVASESGAPSFSRKADPGGWLAALFAACLFILIHGRDGLAEGGQRDLTMAVLLIAATAFLFVAVRRNSLWSSAAFGLLSGIAITIKPTTLPLTLVQTRRSLSRRYCGAGRIARTPPTPLPSALPLAYSSLLSSPSSSCCVSTPSPPSSPASTASSPTTPASDTPARLTSCCTASLRCCLWSWSGWPCSHSEPSASTSPARLGTHRCSLAGVLFGLSTASSSARLPYYRYPLLAFLLPLIALDFAHAFDSRHEHGCPIHDSFTVMGGFTCRPGPRCPRPRLWRILPRASVRNPHPPLSVGEHRIHYFSPAKSQELGGPCALRPHSMHRLHLRLLATSSTDAPRTIDRRARRLPALRRRLRPAAARPDPHHPRHRARFPRRPPRPSTPGHRRHSATSTSTAPTISRNSPAGPPSPTSSTTRYTLRPSGRPPAPPSGGPAKKPPPATASTSSAPRVPHSLP